MTTRDGDGRFVGITVNSFASVSLDPPLISFCLAARPQPGQLPQRRAFRGQCPGEDQEALSGAVRALRASPKSSSA